MPWQNNGDYYSFKQDSITQHAPTVSGVYGLFNFRHQIVIGSAANVRDALLHHRRHTKFRFRRFEPTGFTFELCPAERREYRAQELIKEYQPISSPETPIGIATLYKSWRAPEARAFKTEVTVAHKVVKNKVVAIPTKPVTINEKSAESPPAHFTAERFGLAGAFCGIIFLAVGLIGLVPHLKSMFDSVVRNPIAIAESRRQIKTDQATVELQQPSAAATVATVVTSAPKVALPSSSINTNGEPSQSSPTGWRAAAASAVAPATAPKPASTPARQTAVNAEAPTKREAPANLWSVQAMASTDKRLASDWLQKLKGKGYEAFLIEADIKGQTWHRVRVGAFETRQEAENLRAALKSKEGFRDAYVAGNDKTPTTIALNRR